VRKCGYHPQKNENTEVFNGSSRVLQIEKSANIKMKCKIVLLRYYAMDGTTQNREPGILLSLHSGRIRREKPNLWWIL
jgi:hypothetical protein